MFLVTEIIEAIGGEAYNLHEDIKVNDIVTDSRKIKNGDMFIALKGEKFDGHDFIKDVYEKGAKVAVVSKVNENINITQIKVEDTLQAYKDIAKFYRSKFNIPIVAVTGSSGKTSTKEMIASVLSQKYNVHKTQKNFNNEIGLPMTVLNLNENHQVAVLEMGMNHFGEIESLADVARPNIAVITNIGTAHIENLGSRENILKAKMEITTYFDKDNILIVNGDNDLLKNIKSDVYKVIKITIDEEGDYKAYNIIDLGEEGLEFNCKIRGVEYKFRVTSPGRHNIYNALAAIAVGDLLNLNFKEIYNGILNFNPGNMRMNIVEINNNIKLIIDCYNANPDSMKVALDVLSNFKGRRIAVLGDMFELGEYAIKFHREVGEYSIDKCDVLIAIGEFAKEYYDGVKDKITAFYFNKKEDAIDFIKTFVKENDIILIKASRGMKLEEVSDSLISYRK